MNPQEQTPQPIQPDPNQQYAPAPNAQQPNPVPASMPMTYSPENNQQQPIVSQPVQPAYYAESTMAPTQKSKLGMFVAIGAIVLILLIGGIVLISLSKKSGKNGQTASKNDSSSASQETPSSAKTFSAEELLSKDTFEGIEGVTGTSAKTVAPTKMNTNGVSYTHSGVQYNSGTISATMTLDDYSNAPDSSSSLEETKALVGDTVYPGLGDKAYRSADTSGSSIAVKKGNHIIYMLIDGDAYKNDSDITLLKGILQKL